MWDGTAWTEVADLPTALASAGLAGDNTTGLLAGGITTVDEYTGVTTAAEAADIDFD